MLPALPGTVLLVSHDRAFLNNVVTSTIVFEGNGVLGEYDGGYDDWLRVKEQRANAVDEMTVATSGGSGKASGQTTPTSTAAAVAKTRRLSFKEQRELEQMPELIASLEKRQKELEKEMAAPGFPKRRRQDCESHHRVGQRRCEAGSLLPSLGRA